jgi:hypothetical protein
MIQARGKNIFCNTFIHTFGLWKNCQSRGKKLFCVFMKRTVASGVPGALSLGVKWLGHETDHSLPSSAEVKECMELYLHSPNTSS